MYLDEGPTGTPIETLPDGMLEAESAAAFTGGETVAVCEGKVRLAPRAPSGSSGVAWHE